MPLPNRSVGFILFRRMESQIQYLLLKASNGGHWSPPKGHVEQGEDDKATAFRETEEEVGYKPSDLVVIPNFKRELSYEAWGRPKVTVYYLAEVVDGTKSVAMSDEHTEFQWQPVEQACCLADYEDLQAVLRDGQEFLSSQNS